MILPLKPARSISPWVTDATGREVFSTVGMLRLDVDQILKSVNDTQRFCERQCYTKADALRVCAALVERSAWFKMEPLPDDVWLFAVKKEHDEFLAIEIMRAPVAR